MQLIESSADGDWQTNWKILDDTQKCVGNDQGYVVVLNRTTNQLAAKLKDRNILMLSEYIWESGGLSCDALREIQKKVTEYIKNQ